MNKALYCLNILLLFLTGIRCRHISPASKAGDGSPGNRSEALHSPQKRFQIQINQDPSVTLAGAEATLNTAIEESISLAQLVVDHIHPNHQLFLRFFGSNEYFDEIMNVYRTIANLRTANNDQLLTFNIVPGQAPGDSGRGEVVAEFEMTGGGNGGNTRVFNIFEQSLAMTHSLGAILPGAPFPGQLDTFDVVAARILFHELVHMAGAGIPITNDPSADFVSDVYLYQFRSAGSESDRQLLADVPFEVQAYGEDYVLLLPQLSSGVFGAALNADSYTLMAIAAWIAWTASTSEPIVKPPDYDDADTGDPFKNASPPPPSDPDQPNRYKAIFGMLGRIQSDL